MQINTDIESTYAWVRLAASFTLLTIGGSAMYLVVVVMPAIELEFAATRAQASLPYSMIMLGWATGTFFMRKILTFIGG